MIYARLLAALLCLGIAAPARGADAVQGRPVRLKTQDGWELSASYVPAGKSAAVVMLHGLDAGKGEWEPLERQLAARGVATLAIDLRGHGDNRAPGKRGEKRSWKTFADRGPRGEWAKMWRDVEAGVRFLKARGRRPIGIVGASLGANVAFVAAGRLPEVRFTALLSPGLEYQGVRADAALAPYGPRPLLLAASGSDEYAYQSAAVLRQLRAIGKLPADWLQAPAGHGAQMFRDAQTLRLIADWLAEKARDAR